mmetsp:Transcript_3197/g.2848  ORF Transcript_3197/g.2848 Transcript_3197/m.2848 type:complete len:146 (-) Transcript_3197:45-482(-)
MSLIYFTKSLSFNCCEQYDDHEYNEKLYFNRDLATIPTQKTADDIIDAADNKINRPNIKLINSKYIKKEDKNRNKSNYLPDSSNESEYSVYSDQGVTGVNEEMLTYALALREWKGVLSIPSFENKEINEDVKYDSIKSKSDLNKK